MIFLLNTVATTAMLLSGFAGAPVHGVLAEGAPSLPAVSVENGDSPYVTPEQCLIWKISNPALYLKYCT